MDTPPTGFQFPADLDAARGHVVGTDYSSWLIRATAEVAPLAQAATDLVPPVMAHVSALVATLESTTGLSIGALAGAAQSVATLATSTDPASITAAVGDLVGSSLQITASTLEAAEMASDFASAVPVLGTFVSIVTGLVVEIFKSQGRYIVAQDDCESYWGEQVNALCRQLVVKATPQSTMAGGYAPSDLFRPFAYALQVYERGGAPALARIPRMPLNPASIYVALCGDALPAYLPRGWKWPFLKGQINPIPKATRRRMWSLIRAICAAIQRPGIQAQPEYIGDAGRVLLPVLQEIVRGLYLNKTLTDAHLSDAAKTVTRSVSLGDYCPWLVAGEVGAGATPYAHTSCADGRVDLLPSFISGIVEYQNGLFAAFWENGKWKVSPSAAFQLPVKAKAMLQLSPSAQQTVLGTKLNLRRVPVSPAKRAVVGASAATILGAAAALGAALL